MLDAPVPLSAEELDLKAQKEMFDRLNKVSTSLCLAKWMQVTLHLHNGFNQSCHHVKSHAIPKEKLDENPTVLHNTPFKMKMRKQMMTNTRPAECDYCWAFEDKGRLSDRSFKSSDSWASEHFDEVVQKGADEPILPTNVEISFENTCNLKCMYCGPQFSTKWMEETENFGSYPTSDNHGSINDLKREGRMPFPRGEENPYVKAFWHWWPQLSPKLKVFRITGGEPLLSPNTWKVFESLIENPNPNLHFCINSNLTLSEPIITKLMGYINRLEGKVKRFTIYTSVDTHGEQAEYIRYGLDFKVYQKNVERILTEATWPIEMSYMITVNALSLARFPELLVSFHEQRQRHTRHFITFDTPLLRDPRHMSIKILPTTFHTMVDRALEVLKSRTEAHGPGGFRDWEIQRVDRIRTLIAEDPYDPVELKLRRIDFYLMYKEYDRRKGTNFLKTFPEYAEFYLACEKLANSTQGWKKLFSPSSSDFDKIPIGKTGTG